MPVDVLVPPLGTTTDTLMLVAWLKSEGETVAKGEPLFSVETDKAVLEVESPASGVLCAVRATPGDEVPVLSVVASIAAPGEAVPAVPAADSARPKLEINTPVPESLKPEAASAPAATLPASGPSSTRRPPVPTADAAPRPAHDSAPFFSSPRARVAAETAGIDWKTLFGTGPEGAVVERDVLGAAAVRAERGVGETRPWAESGTIAGLRVGLSDTPLTLAVDTDAAPALALTSELAKSGLAIDSVALLIKAVGAALRQVPELNASLDGGQVQHWTRVHATLVSLNPDGASATVLRDIDSAPARDIAFAIRSAAASSESGTPPNDLLAGNSFTVVDWGALGLDTVSPLLHLPDWPQLSVARIRDCGTDPAGRKTQRVWIALTVDPRLANHATAARFLNTLQAFWEDPLGAIA